MGRRFNPWRTLRRRPDVTVLFGDPGPGVLGCIDYETRTITLAPDLLQAELRTTLTHELVHLERGPAPTGGGPREETTVELEAARRLISIGELVSAVRWTDDVHELAVELWVDEPAVQVRLRHLTDREHATLAAAWQAREGADDAHLPTVTQE
jgi:hypothetical protein